MPFLPTLPPAVTVASVGVPGVISLLRVSSSNVITQASASVKGWPAGARPISIRGTGNKGLYVVLCATASGSEIDVIRASSGSAAVVDRSRTTESFASLEPGPTPGKFFLPQTSGEGGVLAVTNRGKIHWFRLPSHRRSQPDYVIVGTPVRKGDRPFWLSATTLSESISFGVTELRGSRPVKLTQDGAPITSVQAIGAWRRGPTFAAIDMSGTSYELFPKSGESRAVKGSPNLPYLAAFAALNSQAAIAVGEDKALLLSPHGLAWFPVASCPVDKGSVYDAKLSVDNSGRWAAITRGPNGSLSLIAIVGKNRLKLVAHRPNFLGSANKGAAVTIVVN
jgi:hypothetical protein